MFTLWRIACLFVTLTLKQCSATIGAIDDGIGPYESMFQAKPNAGPWTSHLTTQNEVTPINHSSFTDEAAHDLETVDPEALNVPSGVVFVERPGKDKANLKGTCTQAKNKMELLSVRPPREEIQSGDVVGCGAPVCVILDAKPKTFASMCSLVSTMNSFYMVRRFMHIQKGTCDEAIEGSALKNPWDERAHDCSACTNQQICKGKICIAYSGKARTFNGVCEAMQTLWNKNDINFVMIGLGDCADLLSNDGFLYTEWFDIDEPCKVGDVESAAQNLALAATYEKTGRFRMCPKIRQVGYPEFQTIEGEPIPRSQVVEKDFDNLRLVCENKKQLEKPQPPHYWFDKDIKCRDYKIRHKCKCLYGCHTPKDGVYAIDMPQIDHLFEECEWREFISNDCPQVDTWDGEDRGAAVQTKKKAQVCGEDIFNAMYIDIRRIEDNLPFDETGEFITKATPWYGFLCINKNNKIFGKTCSDYKVRYCCHKKEPAQWGKWSQWSECSKTCGGGIRKRDRVCVVKKGEKETCFGNWIAKTPDGQDKFGHLKYQVSKCNEIGCPEDAMFTEWRPWEACPVTCGQSKRRRRRGCDPGRHGGKECPTDRSLYVEWTDCDLPPCPDPLWTKWSEWSQCTLTCGLGIKKRHRQCEDSITGVPLEPGFDCLGGSTEMTEDCKLTDCPIDGQWTEWQNWGLCSVLCGKVGHQIRRRYCAAPLPQFGGKKCEGNDKETRSCPDLKPCPQHCLWSQWGSWSACSISCGPIGAGLQTRGRHIAQEAKYGGRECTGSKTENKVCPHERMLGTDKKESRIFFCPVDCEWGEWGPWSKCPDCYGDLSGYFESDLQDFVQDRIRRIKTRARYRGKKCPTPSQYEERVGKCDTSVVPPCPANMRIPFTSQWSEWGSCEASCGSRGKKVRKRDCIGDGNCDGKLTETVPCQGFCPPEGWSQWDEWSTCPVTCGTAQRARKRVCLDDPKDETKGELGQSTCRGVARETQRCDMGPCGSKIDLTYEGGSNVDPVEKFEKMEAEKEQKFSFGRY